MKSPITVSIIAPVYGVERFIADFADSAFSQTYPHVEFIFVNDGTKDRSIEVLNGVIDQKYSHLRERIRIIDKQNGGLPAARKTGVEHATGDYLWHVDPDDWLELDAVESIVRRIEETGAEVVYFNLFKEYEDKSKVKRDRWHAENAQAEYVWDMFNHKSFGSVCNKCIKRSLYDNERVIFAEYSYAEDTFLSSQLVGYSTCISFLDKPLYHYRKTNPNAITRQNLKKRHREYALNFMRLYDHYRDLPLEQSPIASIHDEILIKLGWYSILYGVDLYKDYPYLASDIRKAKVNSKADVFILGQLLAKLVARFK
jgi:glycosyltransferase involved in cell wall biosynthesis